MVSAIRQAVPGDFDGICAVDEVAARNALRRQRIFDGVSNSEIWVIASADSIMGYALLSYRFFGHGFMELVLIHPNHQGSGHGPRLIQYLESVCTDPKLFTTINESNLRMQKVLERLGYQKSGIIHNIDPGDPELVYFKLLRSSAVHVQ
jgi:N-acetylglutamate synthase-like GNAT family acetyltransferase